MPSIFPFVKQPKRRTTMIFDKRLLRRLKRCCIENDISMRVFITNAVRNELKRNSQRRKEKKLKPVHCHNTFALRLMKLLEPIASFGVVKSQVIRVCEAHNIRINGLSPRHLTRDFINALCNSLEPFTRKNNIKRVKNLLNRVHRAEITLE